MDTTANAMSRILHLLAQHPNVQEKLRREVVEARACGVLDYDKLHALPYLDAVCRETLRLYVYAVHALTTPLTLKHLMQVCPGAADIPRVSASCSLPSPNTDDAPLAGQ